MLQSKDIEWLNEKQTNKKKTKTHIYTAYQRLTSDLKTQTESVRWEKVFHANGNKQKIGEAILR